MTLIELLAAITIAGLVLLGAVFLLSGVDDAAKRVIADAESITANANPSLELHDLFAGAFATFDTSQRFEGNERAMTFSTRCPAREGWFERCRAVLLIDDGRLRARLDDAPWRILRHYHADTRLRYFAAERGEWKASWFSSASVPDAIGFVTPDDTVVYAVGPSRE